MPRGREGTRGRDVGEARCMAGKGRGREPKKGWRLEEEGKVWYYMDEMVTGVVEAM